MGSRNVINTRPLAAIPKALARSLGRPGLRPSGAYVIHALHDNEFQSENESIGANLKKENEINALEATFAILQKYYHISDPITEKRYPDEESSNKKDIDCVARIGNKKVAIEHTIIEIYDGQIEYTYNSFDFIQQINTDIKELLPKDRYYEALIQPSLIVGKGKKELKTLAGSIKAELIKNITTLEIGNSIRILHNGEEVVIYCQNYEGLERGMLYRAPTLPTKDFELKHRKRIARLLNDKLYKLIRYKLKGCITILTIEDISGRHMQGIKKDDVCLIHKLMILFFVNIGIVLVSNNKKMIVGNVWKDTNKWYQNIPMRNRFSLTN